MPASSWLLFIHQLPQKPDYLRIKISRRLRALGARPIKNSVYVLPHSESAVTALESLVRDIVREGGEAALCQARFVAGRSDDEIAAMFYRSWEEEYAAIAKSARSLRGQARPRQVRALEARLARLTSVDRLGVPARAEAEAALRGLATPASDPAAVSHRARTWVTRRGVLIDRIASAWLIRHFIDRRARFRFVSGPAEPTRASELRFDMPGGDFTHLGDRCTFEVLVERFVPDDLSLRQVAEIVHDVDLQDGKFGRAEAEGVERAIFGIAQSTADDRERLARGAALFDAFYTSFEKRPALGGALARRAATTARERKKEKSR